MKRIRTTSVDGSLFCGYVCGSTIIRGTFTACVVKLYVVQSESYVPPVCGGRRFGVLKKRCAVFQSAKESPKETSKDNASRLELVPKERTKER